MENTEIKKNRTHLNLSEEPSASTSSDVNQDFKAPRNMMDVSPVAAASIRNSVSSRAAAEIATAALISAGVIDQTNLQFVMDHNKVKRARDKLLKDQQATDAADIKEKKIQCIFFDGRKDQTLVFREVYGIKNQQQSENILFCL